MSSGEDKVGEVFKAMNKYSTEIVVVGTHIDNILSAMNHERQDSVVYGDKDAETHDRLHVFLPIAFILPSAAIGAMAAASAYSGVAGYC